MNELEEMKSAKAEYDRICQIHEDFIKEHTNQTHSDVDAVSNMMSRSSIENMSTIEIKTIEDVIQWKEIENKRLEYHKKYVDLYIKAKQKGLIQ
jgi:beta-galactosidase beta subunit